MAFVGQMELLTDIGLTNFRMPKRLDLRACRSLHTVVLKPCHVVTACELLLNPLVFSLTLASSTAPVPVPALAALSCLTVLKLQGPVSPKTLDLSATVHLGQLTLCSCHHLEKVNIARDGSRLRTAAASACSALDELSLAACSGLALL